jgi:hypothetical protein
MIIEKGLLMNEFSTFAAGVSDATADLLAGPVFAGGPTETPVLASLDYIVNEFRIRLGCSDSYLAGYLSVLFSE